MDEQGVLDGWKGDYGLNEGVLFMEYAPMARSVLGYWTLDRDKRSVVYLSSVLEGHDLMAKALLWHEFCHAWEWIEDRTSGHGPGFLKRLLKKPWYPVIEFCAAIYSHIAR